MKSVCTWIFHSCGRTNNPVRTQHTNNITEKVSRTVFSAWLNLHSYGAGEYSLNIFPLGGRLSHRYACSKLISVPHLSFDSCLQAFRLFLGKPEEHGTFLKIFSFLCSVKGLSCKEFFKPNAYSSCLYLLNSTSFKEEKVSVFWKATQWSSIL